MKNWTHMRWLGLVSANVLTICVLSFYQQTTAAPPAPREPFANAIEQRFETIRQLEKLNKLLAEQNDLLRSGKLQVQVVLPTAKR